MAEIHIIVAQNPISGEETYYAKNPDTGKLAIVTNQKAQEMVDALIWETSQDDDASDR